MQEKEQKISPVKQRILSFAASLGCSKREFYASIGVSRGTLESNTGITEDVVAKFIATYPQVNLQWLWTGVGSPIDAPTQKKEQKISSVSTLDTNLIDKLVQNISDQAEEIGRLKARVEQLEEELQKVGSSADDATSTHAALA